jgi:hypothetical protein
VQAAAPDPLHVAQLASHAVHTRSEVAEHAALWYSPAAHAPEQLTQAVPFR